MIPLGSEWLLIILLLGHSAPVETVGVATLGNTLGGCTTYWIGLWGADFFIRKILRINPENLLRAKTLYSRYGSWSLLLSWLPIVGDPLCLLGGIFRMRFFRFLFLIFSGKLGRYALVAFFTLKTI